MDESTRCELDCQVWMGTASVRSAQNSGALARLATVGWVEGVGSRKTDNIISPNNSTSVLLWPD